MRLATGWRQAVRVRQRVVAEMRARINAAVEAGGFKAARQPGAVSLTLSQQDFETLEWAMGYVKVRDPLTGKFVRVNQRFMSAKIARPHLLIKGCPVFCG